MRDWTGHLAPRVKVSPVMASLLHFCWKQSPFPKQRCDSHCCGFRGGKPLNKRVAPEWLLSPQEKEIEPLSWDQLITHESFYRGTARQVCHLVLFALAEPECSPEVKLLGLASPAPRATQPRLPEALFRPSRAAGERLPSDKTQSC